MYTLLLLLIYMAFISLGLPDSLLGSAWPIMHEAFSVPLSYAGLVTMIISADDLFKFNVGTPDKEIWNTDRYGMQCPVNGSCLVWFFDVERILHVVPVGDSVWTWRRSYRCGTQ